MRKPNTIGLGEYTMEDLAEELNRRFLERTDRVEVIYGDEGRSFVKGSIYGTPVSPQLSIQDEGATLKIFVEDIE